MSAIHTVAKTQKQDAHDMRSSDEAPRSVVSWKSYTLHILIAIVIIEGFILVNIYKSSNISGLFLNILIGFVALAFVLVIIRILIEVLVNTKIKVMENEVMEYIAYKKANEIKTVQNSKALHKTKQKIKAY